MIIPIRPLPLLAIILCITLSHSGIAQVLIDNSVQICPANNPLTPPADFNAPQCSTSSAAKINPQHHLIWVQAQLSLNQNHLDTLQPPGLFIAGKAASRIYLNGSFIGHNGTPGHSAKTEQPGRMDAVFTIPHSLLRIGPNRLQVLLSAHHGWLNLNHPIHWIGLDRYSNPGNQFLRHYWPALILLGALVLGAIYLSVQIISSGEKKRGLLPAIMALLAALQLLAEVARGLFPYTYPYHDLRLLMILLCALGFGLCLLAHVIWQYHTRYRTALFAGGSALTLLSIIAQSGYDPKSISAFLVPAAIAAALSLYRVIRHRGQALPMVAALVLFIVIILYTPSRFLDVYFYYEVAALLLFFFIQQALALNRERHQRIAAQTRADRLQMALDQRHKKNQPQQIKVTGTGKVEWIAIDRITYCKGAGDYVEFVFSDGSHTLHSESLTKLENRLPATFLRIHRSYLVNTAFIRSLKRQSNGVGYLILTNDAQVPVSRRIMPKLKQVLAD